MYEYVFCSGEEVETLGTEGLFIDRFSLHVRRDNTKLLYFPIVPVNGITRFPRSSAAGAQTPNPKEMVDIVLAKAASLAENRSY